MANIIVLSAGAIRRGVTAVAGLFEKESGHRVAAEFSSAPKALAKVMAGEPADVLIASARELDELAQGGRLLADARAPVGRASMGVIVCRGAPKADLSTPEAFRRALAAADLLVYNEGSSGAYAAALVDRLGLRAELGAKIRVVKNGAEMLDCLTGMHGNVIGLSQITSAVDAQAKGVAVELGGAFPEALQNVTQYGVAVLACSREPDAARAFVRAFGTPGARSVLTASGLS